jgi:hypothetical protein
MLPVGEGHRIVFPGAAGATPAPSEPLGKLRMIRHIVLFSAKNPSDIDAIHQALAKLKAIPHARHVEVSRNAKKDSLSKEIDIVVYAEFDDYGQLDKYKAHPLYLKSIEVVRPLRDVRIAADYEISGQPAAGITG